MKIKYGLETEYAEYKAKNSDPYGHGVVIFAERWARDMEKQIAMDGGDPADIITKHAKRLSYEADTDGITGFMYGCAVQSLAKFWEHGEALRRWHNLDTQIGKEGERANESGGVLNPAILNIPDVRAD